jgi:hypothetical protein
MTAFKYLLERQENVSDVDKEHMNVNNTDICCTFLGSLCCVSDSISPAVPTEVD